MRWWPRVAEATPLDTAWLKAHPLPDHHDNVDKNGRGRVLVIGGCRRVPGGMLLTAEAAFRAGAGKVTIATIASAAIPIGIAFPACAVVALPETEAGEIAPEAAELLLAEVVFFVCPQQHVRLDFNIASEYDFICPECGEELEFFDNSNYLEQIRQYQKDCEKEFKDFKKELKKYAKKNKKNFDDLL